MPEKTCRTICEFLGKLDELKVLVRHSTLDLKCSMPLPTIHSSKGLEYDRVILFDMIDDILPWEPELEEKTEEEELREDWRIFYVSFTRAKTNWLCRNLRRIRNQPLPLSYMRWGNALTVFSPDGKILTEGGNAMILYHGSENIVRAPQYGYGSAANDYGLGFYCTEDLGLAKEWACLRGRDGYANQYSLDTHGLLIVNLNGPTYNILNWIAVLTQNRRFEVEGMVSSDAIKYLQKNFLPDLSDADIVTGYRADDSYFSFARAFVSNALSVQKLEQAMRLGNLGEQIVLKSRKAFKQITFTEAIPVDRQTYFRKANQRDKEARQAYRKRGHIDDMYMIEIMRRGLTNEDFNSRV